jgi:hypothetical protein
MNEQITDPGIEFYLRELHHLRPEADEHYATVANGIQERINALRAKLAAAEKELVEANQTLRHTLQEPKPKDT